MNESNLNQGTLTNPTEGYITVLENGSRVYEVRVNSDEPTALWTNEAAFTNKEWNIGGERTWISPEIDFFINNNHKYQVPDQLDPGHYNLEAYNDYVKTAQIMELTNQRTQQSAQLHLEKTYSLLENPFKASYHSRFDYVLDVPYVGYQCVTDLSLSSTYTSASGRQEEFICNAWSITQVPEGGTVLIPTMGAPEPLIMFQDPGIVPMVKGNNELRVSYQGNNKFKLSLDVFNSTGRMGYIKPINAQKSSLIIKEYQLNLSGVYPDYPDKSPRYLGSCTQFFYDGNQMGSFGELEYHTPAVSATKPRSKDTANFYYYVGETAKINFIAKCMLGFT
jgi:hypothetical protein